LRRCSRWRVLVKRALAAGEPNTTKVSCCSTGQLAEECKISRSAPAPGVVLRLACSSQQAFPPPAALNLDVCNKGKQRGINGCVFGCYANVRVHG
jgi:hypothetical protein